MKIKYQLFEAGYCRHCERMTMKKGGWHQCQYPSICALIHHPEKGYILFDTGYSERFNLLTRKFPASLYRRLTPMTLPKSLKEQLIAIDIMPEEIKYIIISHFHADHIGGLCDFPNAQFIAHPEAIEDIRSKKGLKALLSGFLPRLLPDNFYDRLQFPKTEIKLDNHLSPFKYGMDVFLDSSLIAIPLPGHAKGQIGLYFKSFVETFLVADSCWHEETFKTLSYPSELTYLVHHDKKAYKQTIRKLHQLHLANQDIDIIPSHCKHMRLKVKNTSC